MFNTEILRVYRRILGKKGVGEVFPLLRDLSFCGPRGDKSNEYGSTPN